MKKFLSLLPGLALLLALAGCCANDVCVCNDNLADALFFRFKIGGPDGFRASEVDTLYIVRTTHPNAKTNTVATSDSVLRVLRLTPDGTALTRDTANVIIINNAAPFASAGGNIKLNAYDYHLSAYQRDRAAPTGRRRYTFLIKNIKLSGQYNANGCCTCYENTLKQFDISSHANAQDFRTQDVTAPINQPIVTFLTR